MDILHKNKFTSHAEDDSISPDSLSFSGLVCIQNQQPKLPSPNHVKHYNQVSKNDPEFEFTSTKASLNSAVSPIKTTPADLLISNGQLQPQPQPQPQPHAFQTNQALMRGSVSPSIATHNSRKMSGKTGSANGSHEKHDKASQSKNMESTAKRPQFGHKMKCFLSPCRNSKAITPGAVKAQTAPRPQESFNLFFRD